MKRNHHGFTIVELIIAIVVIAILASVSVVAYGALRNRARDTTLETKVTDVSQKLATYSLANQNKYPGSLNEIDVNTPDDMTLDYTRSADKKSYYLVATIGDQSYALSNKDQSANKCQGLSCAPEVDPSISTAIVASSENSPYETADKAFDNSLYTKWLAWEKAPSVIFSTTESIMPTKYSLSSANDAQGRDPVSWTLYGSTDRSNWQQLDSQTYQYFSSRYSTKTYNLNSFTYYNHYRLSIDDNRSDSSTQISEIKLYDSSGQATVIR